MYLDPTGTVSVSLPPGWAFDALSSSLTDLVFVDWAHPNERQMFVRVYPSHTSGGASDDEWEAEVRPRLPPDATRVERRDGPVILVERPGREGRPHQRWAIRRGPRFDATIEDVGVPLGGALLTAELAEALRTIDVPVNRYLGEPPALAEFEDAMQSAHARLQKGDGRGAVGELSHARELAKSAWLHSLIGRPLPEVPAVISAAEVMLALAKVTQSALFLQHGALMLYRCRGSLAGSRARSAGAQLARVEALLQEALQIHGEMAGEPPPKNAFSASLMRSRVLLTELKKMLADDQSKAGGPWAALAVEEAMTAAALAGRGLVRAVPDHFVATLVAKGITDTDEQLRAVHHIFVTTALDHLVAAGGLLYATRAEASLDPERTVTANWLLAARRLIELSPSPERDQGLVLAISGHAAAFLSLGDEASLNEAGALLDEAEAVLDRLADEGELRGQICLNQAWLRHYRRQVEGSVALLDRSIACARRSTSTRLERAARSLRSQFLTVMGRHDEALDDARFALEGARDALSTNHLNLAIVLNRSGDATAALEEVRAGLAAAVADDPLGAGALRLLFVAGAILDSIKAAGALAATEAAEMVLDVMRRRVGDTVDRIGFDDADRHREIAARLVQRRLDADDILGALATADRHRARSLAEAVGSSASPAGPSRGEKLTPPPEGTSLDEYVAFIARSALAALSREGIPQPLDGRALADVVADAGRTAILMHPAGEDLLAFVIRPGHQVTVAVATAAVPVSRIVALTDGLRAQLGIIVSARAARGEAPAQSIEDLTAALADDDTSTEDADVELDRLRGELHAALFSEVLPLLPEGEPIVVVPYRELAIIPLSVLTAPDGRPLAERHPVSVLPSLASLNALAKPGAAPARAVVVGDPVVASDLNLGPLPGAEAEARHVARQLGEAGIETTMLLQRDATETAFRDAARGARIVHLACHAAVRQQASASPLFFTPEPPDDGLLLPAEIADLRLDGALVVLAACQSGLGRATADGVLGLGRAFVQAGARVVVMSLWRVSDAATAHLMAAFYDALLGVSPQTNGGLDVAAAMRHAQLLTRTHVSPDPGSWGPWLVVGDGGWRLHHGERIERGHHH